MKTPFKENGPIEAHFMTVRIRIPLEDYDRGLPYFGSRKKLNEFIAEAFREKVNRAVANDKVARQREVLTNAALLEPAITELYRQGKLNFLVKP